MKRIITIFETIAALVALIFMSGCSSSPSQYEQRIDARRLYVETMRTLYCGKPVSVVLLPYTETYSGDLQCIEMPTSISNSTVIIFNLQMRDRTIYNLSNFEISK